MLQIIKIDRKNCGDCEQNVDEKSEEEAKNTEYFKAWSRAKFMKIRRSCRFRRKTLILACKDRLRCSPERIVQSLGAPAENTIPKKFPWSPHLALSIRAGLGGALGLGGGGGAALDLAAGAPY